VNNARYITDPIMCGYQRGFKRDILTGEAPNKYN
jgi:hypothetical protein